MIRRPPRSTLFPSTPLSRSQRPREGELARPRPAVLVRDAANEAESVWLAHPSYVSGRSTSPLGTFGTKYVDLGGMTSPASATANTSSTLVGLRRTAAAALPVRTASNAARGSGV